MKTVIVRIKNTLALAVIALFVAGCSTTQSTAMQEPAQPVRYAETADLGNLTGGTGEQDTTKATTVPATSASVEPAHEVRPQATPLNLSLLVFGLSYHPDREGVRTSRLDNEVNIGLGLKYNFHDDDRGVVFFETGIYRDSGKNWAKFAGPGYQFKLSDRLRLGASVPLVQSRTYNRGNAFVATIPTLTYDFGRVKLNAVYIPRIQLNEFAVYAVYFSIPLLK